MTDDELHTNHKITCMVSMAMEKKMWKMGEEENQVIKYVLKFQDNSSSQKRVRISW